ncbi:uncharacterized protein B0H18DRAFT_960896 [Fomitopsis serialis]|uniref:uncharacterized protein n=1 Tax=Fomitopsis serialis TaxID=139415 RepID=UPI002008C933|nr:uncharacterized protein B0H18DRAFT_960896 [Neoantrodia serialis]KAH9912655.1 hypothetical protein B0H18DRAFT_960896 [Neoantrodia serialis]
MSRGRLQRFRTVIRLSGIVEHTNPSRNDPSYRLFGVMPMLAFVVLLRQVTLMLHNDKNLAVCLWTLRRSPMGTRPTDERRATSSNLLSKDCDVGRQWDADNDPRYTFTHEKLHCSGPLLRFDACWRMLCPVLAKEAVNVRHLDKPMIFA